MGKSEGVTFNKNGFRNNVFHTRVSWTMILQKQENLEAVHSIKILFLEIKQ